MTKKYVYNFTYHQDPSHGWIQVHLKFLKEIGADLSKISNYSYYHPQSTGDALVYLEEDGDAMVLINALKEKGIKYVIHERHIDRPHWIRRLVGRFPELLEEEKTR